MILDLMYVCGAVVAFFLVAGAVIAIIVSDLGQEILFYAACLFGGASLCIFIYRLIGGLWA